MDKVDCWILTDGKAGDEQQCLGVAEAMGLEPDLRRVKPRPPFAWAMPWGPIDPAEGPDKPESPIAPSYPALVIASGRRAIPYAREVKRLSEGRSFVAVLKDPRTARSGADLIWVPEHDRLRGEDVLVTLTSPHRVSAARLAAARASPDPRVAALAPPRAAVIVGGDSRHHRFTPEDVERLVTDLAALASSGVSLMGSLSRRSSPPLRHRLRQLFAGAGGFLWDGAGENPYIPLLALADAVVVTADSANMVGEAAATGRPILLFTPSGGHPKLDRMIEGLRRHGAVQPFHGRLEGTAYEPLDSTPVIADAVRRGLARHRASLARAVGEVE